MVLSQGEHRTKLVKLNSNKACHSVESKHLFIYARSTVPRLSPLYAFKNKKNQRKKCTKIAGARERCSSERVERIKRCGWHRLKEGINLLLYAALSY